MKTWKALNVRTGELPPATFEIDRHFLWYTWRIGTNRWERGWAWTYRAAVVQAFGTHVLRHSVVES